MGFGDVFSLYISYCIVCFGEEVYCNVLFGGEKIAMMLDDILSFVLGRISYDLGLYSIVLFGEIV